MVRLWMSLVLIMIIIPEDIAIVQSTRNWTQFSVIAKNTELSGVFLPFQLFIYLPIQINLYQVFLEWVICESIYITNVIVILQRLFGLQWPTTSELIERSLSSEQPFHFTFHIKCSQQDVIWLSVKSWSPCYPYVLAKIILPKIGKPWKVLVIE